MAIIWRARLYGQKLYGSVHEVFHIPLMAAAPVLPLDAAMLFTQNIDVFPTVLEYFGISEDVLQYPIHGRSLLPVLRGEKESVRESAIYGYFGKQIAWDRREIHLLPCSKGRIEQPLYVYTAMPTVLRQMYGGNDAVNTADYDRIEMGAF